MAAKNDFKLSDSERRLVRGALSARVLGLSKLADPENPWFDQDSADEVVELKALMVRFEQPQHPAVDDVLTKPQPQGD